MLYKISHNATPNQLDTDQRNKSQVTSDKFNRMRKSKTYQ